jgi:diaminohydroxyphosphoribosylaminopyrimidine deaminase/5-amino-6-(5-phosphoribosylamino)uracil reductase
VERKHLLREQRGVDLVECDTGKTGRVSIPDLVQKLGERGILSLLVEGGSDIIGAFFEAGLADQLILFISPKIVGNGIPFTRYPIAQSIGDSLHLSVVETYRIEDDIYYRAYVNYPN